MSGNLSHQSNTHLFPDMPANRYKEVAPKIKALCAEYGINSMKLISCVSSGPVMCV